MSGGHTSGRVGIDLHHGDCVAWLTEQAARIAAGEAEAFDSCVTDPPYHLTSIVKRFGKAGSAPAKVGATGAYARASRGFMGKEWDGGDVAFRPETWRAVFDCLKPGAHLVAFSGTRTYHRMAAAIEDAGFEIRDQLAWVYGSGFPKSHDISKAIDKAAGHWRGRAGPVVIENQPAKGKEYLRTEKGDPITAEAEAEAWRGWGTALKPALEPICLARKPIDAPSVAANVLAHGTGALNIDGCRVEFAGAADRECAAVGGRATGRPMQTLTGKGGAREAFTPSDNSKGRWPANLCHDGSEEALAGFGAGGAVSASLRLPAVDAPGGRHGGAADISTAGGDSAEGGRQNAARFFYSAKAGPLDRIGTRHATVKPVDLMRWLVRLVTPTGGRVLEPFAGSGTTAIACMAEGFDCTMIELEADHVADIQRKLAHLRGAGRHSFIEHDRRRDDAGARPAPAGGLFDLLGDAQ